MKNKPWTFKELASLGLMCCIIIFGLVKCEKAEAGMYLDIGIGYMRGVDITRSASLNVGGHTVSATARLEAPEDTSYGFIRVGYERRGWHLEYETRGIPEYHIDSVNLYHRWRF